MDEHAEKRAEKDERYPGEGLCCPVVAYIGKRNLVEYIYKPADADDGLQYARKNLLC